jgi:hypothetical protein
MPTWGESYPENHPLEGRLSFIGGDLPSNPSLSLANKPSLGNHIRRPTLSSSGQSTRRPLNEQKRSATNSKRSLCDNGKRGCEDQLKIIHYPSTFSDRSLMTMCPEQAAKRKARRVIPGPFRALRSGAGPYLTTPCRTEPCYTASSSKNMRLSCSDRHQFECLIGDGLGENRRLWVKHR